jgi:phosphoenolpyruvate-protein kinase (PTS system EI component)
MSDMIRSFNELTAEGQSFVGGKGGAPLSHAAIVARELGIPAVVGCGDATMRLKTGDRVRVDGGQGTVEILEIRDSTEV